MLKKILVPLDTSAVAEQALPTAAALAKANGAELRLMLAHELAPYDGYPDAPWNGARSSMESTYLDSKAHGLEEQFGIRVVAEYVKGDIVPSIVRVAEDRQIDLIVMTTHGRTGVSRAWLGSVADAVMRSVDVPVLMLRAKELGGAKVTEPQQFRRLMIPLDGSSRAECIIGTALAIGGTSATYILASAVPPVPLVPEFADPYAITPVLVDAGATDRSAAATKGYLTKTAQHLAEKGATVIEEAVTVADHAAPALLDAAKAHDIDLIALATHGRGTSRFVFGSVADKILRGSSLPILVCRGGKD